MIQPNLSTTIIMTVIVAAMTFASPLKLKWIFAFLGVVVVVLGLLSTFFPQGSMIRFQFYRAIRYKEF